MKKEYLKPASTVVAVAPVKLLNDSPNNPDPIVDPEVPVVGPPLG